MDYKKEFEKESKGDGFPPYYTEWLESKLQEAEQTSDEMNQISYKKVGKLAKENATLQVKLQEANSQKAEMLELWVAYLKPNLLSLNNIEQDGMKKFEELLNEGKPTGGIKTDVFGNPHEHPFQLNESKTHYICNECGFKIMAKRFRKPTGG